MRVALAAAVIAFAACAPRLSATGGPDSPYHWKAVPAAPAPLTVPLSLFEVTYSEGLALHRGVVDAATLAAVSDVELGEATGVRQIAGTDSVIVEADAGVLVVNARGDRHPFAPAVSPLPIGGISARGVIYVADPDRITVVDADGNVLRSIEAPRAKPGLPALPFGFKGVLFPDGSSVEALVFDDLGSFVLVGSPANSAIVDLDSGNRAELLGIRVLDVASRGGHAYILGLDTTVVDADYVLVELDLTSLDVVRTAHVAVPRPARSVHQVRVLVTPRDDVYAYFPVPLTENPLPIRSDLVAFDAGLAATHLMLPNDLGLDATVGADGALYLFGGPARNVVSRFDPLTRDLTSYAVAPAGAYVRALVPR